MYWLCFKCCSLFNTDEGWQELCAGFFILLPLICEHNTHTHTHYPSVSSFLTTPLFPLSITLSVTHSEVHWSEAEHTAVHQPRGLSFSVCACVLACVCVYCSEPGSLEHKQGRKQVSMRTRVVCVNDTRKERESVVEKLRSIQQTVTVCSVIRRIHHTMLQSWQNDNSKQ